MAKIELKTPWDAWQFTTVTEMSERLELLGADGFTGVVSSYQNQQELVWRLTIDGQHVYLSPPSDPAMATWLVLEGQVPTAYTQAAFEARYQIAES